eukprot:7293243-Pyramimonas_sp.AAC.2
MLRMIRAARSLSERATGALRIAGAAQHGKLHRMEHGVQINATRLSPPLLLGGLDHTQQVRHITFVNDPFQREKDQAEAARALEGAAHGSFLKNTSLKMCRRRYSCYNLLCEAGTFTPARLHNPCCVINRANDHAASICAGHRGLEPLEKVAGHGEDTSPAVQCGRRSQLDIVTQYLSLIHISEPTRPEPI